MLKKSVASYLWSLGAVKMGQVQPGNAQLGEVGELVHNAVEVATEELPRPGLASFWALLNPPPMAKRSGNIW
jgi:hypothetical protein